LKIAVGVHISGGYMKRLNGWMGLAAGCLVILVLGWLVVVNGAEEAATQKGFAAAFEQAVNESVKDYEGDKGKRMGRGKSPAHKNHVTRADALVAGAEEIDAAYLGGVALSKKQDKEVRDYVARQVAWMTLCRGAQKNPECFKPLAEGLEESKDMRWELTFMPVGAMREFLAPEKVSGKAHDRWVRTSLIGIVGNEVSLQRLENDPWWKKAVGPTNRWPLAVATLREKMKQTKKEQDEWERTGLLHWRMLEEESYWHPDGMREQMAAQRLKTDGVTLPTAYLNARVSGGDDDVLSVIAEQRETGCIGTIAELLEKGTANEGGLLRCLVRIGGAESAKAVEASLRAKPERVELVKHVMRSSADQTAMEMYKRLVGAAGFEKHREEMQEICVKMEKRIRDDQAKKGVTK
jgi:hypothetical protein